MDVRLLAARRLYSVLRDHPEGLCISDLATTLSLPVADVLFAVNLARQKGARITLDTTPVGEWSRYRLVLTP